MDRAVAVVKNVSKGDILNGLTIGKMCTEVLTLESLNGESYNVYKLRVNGHDYWMQEDDVTVIKK